MASRIAGLSKSKLQLLQRKTNESECTGHALIARCLGKLGITHVYSIAGTPIGETLAACIQQKIRVIGVRHQQAAAMMALAQNYCAGRLVAAVILSAGPGITNSTTGILVAKDNCWPLLVIGGRRSLSMQGMGSFQELDGVKLFSSITNWAKCVDSTAAIPLVMSQAARRAFAPRPGPVYLDLPEEVLNGKYPLKQDLQVMASAPSLLEPKLLLVAKAANILIDAKRPLVILGEGIRWDMPDKQLADLIEAYRIPFITSAMGRGFLPDTHPLCLNSNMASARRTADAILLIGARLDWRFRFGSELRKDVRLVQIETEKSELAHGIVPEVELLGGAKKAINAILACLATNVKYAVERDEDWIESRVAAAASWQSLWEEKAAVDTIPMSPYRLAAIIRSHLPSNAMTILDGNVSMAVMERMLPVSQPVSRLTAGLNGCIGTGIPFGIGAKIQRPDRPVVIITGDAGFGMSGMELETALRHKIPVVVIVVNNQGISGALSQNSYCSSHAERVAMFQADIRYDQINKAFGGYAEHVECSEQLGPALDRALAANRAGCINVAVDPDISYPTN